jgi:hypothetical protein
MCPARQTEEQRQRKEIKFIESELCALCMRGLLFYAGSEYQQTMTAAALHSIL